MLKKWYHELVGDFNINSGTGDGLCLVQFYLLWWEELEFDTDSERNHLFFTKYYSRFWDVNWWAVVILFSVGKCEVSLLVQNNPQTTDRPWEISIEKGP